MIRKACFITGAALIGVTAGAAAGGAAWTHYAGSPSRTSTASLGPATLTTVAWSALPEADEELVHRSSPVSGNGRVFVTSRAFANNTHVANRVIAFDQRDGGRLWDAEIAPDTLDSWSSPALDLAQDVVFVASDAFVYGLEAASGKILWETVLPQPVVNASPAVTSDLTRQRAGANRLFLTDHAPFGGGSLYAINIDPFVPGANPHEPGDIVWTYPLGSTSGNTPAYLAGTVYVAGSDGRVFSVSAADGQEAWSIQASSHGFFGAVALSGGYLYAATYNFYGGQNNSLLYKIDAAGGQTVWRVACERTSATPVIAGNGRIFLSGGIDGFGSVVKIQAFTDLGATAALLWDTYADSAGTRQLGGWTHQPAFAAGRLYAGRLAGAFGPGAQLFVIDPGRSPAEAAFLLSSHDGSGGSPAVSDRSLFSIGEDGLFCFRPVLPDPVN